MFLIVVEQQQQDDKKNMSKSKHKKQTEEVVQNKKLVAKQSKKKVKKEETTAEENILLSSQEMKWISNMTNRHTDACLSKKKKKHKRKRISSLNEIDGNTSESEKQVHGIDNFELDEIESSEVNEDVSVNETEQKQESSTCTFIPACQVIKIVQSCIQKTWNEQSDIGELRLIKSKAHCACEDEECGCSIADISGQNKEHADCFTCCCGNNHKTLEHLFQLMEFGNPEKWIDTKANFKYKTESMDEIYDLTESPSTSSEQETDGRSSSIADVPNFFDSATDNGRETVDETPSKDVIKNSLKSQTIIDCEKTDFETDLSALNNCRELNCECENEESALIEDKQPAQNTETKRKKKRKRSKKSNVKPEEKVVPSALRGFPTDHIASEAARVVSQQIARHLSEKVFVVASTQDYIYVDPQDRHQLNLGYVPVGDPQFSYVSYDEAELRANEQRRTRKSNNSRKHKKRARSGLIKVNTSSGAPDLTPIASSLRSCFSHFNLNSNERSGPRAGREMPLEDFLSGAEGGFLYKSLCLDMLINEYMDHFNSDYLNYAAFYCSGYDWQNVTSVRKRTIWFGYHRELVRCGKLPSLLGKTLDRYQYYREMLDDSFIATLVGRLLLQDTYFDKQWLYLNHDLIDMYLHRDRQFDDADSVVAEILDVKLDDCFRDGYAASRTDTLLAAKLERVTGSKVTMDDNDKLLSMCRMLGYLQQSRSPVATSTTVRDELPEPEMSPRPESADDSPDDSRERIQVTERTDETAATDPSEPDIAHLTSHSVDEADWIDSARSVASEFDGSRGDAVRGALTIGAISLLLWAVSISLGLRLILTLIGVGFFVFLRQ